MNQHKDKEGRIFCIEAKLNDVKVVFCNVYAPYKEKPELFHEVNKILANPRDMLYLEVTLIKLWMASWTEVKITSDQSPEIGLLFTLLKMTLD